MFRAAYSVSYILWGLSHPRGCRVPALSVFGSTPELEERNWCAALYLSWGYLKLIGYQVTNGKLPSAVSIKQSAL